MNLENLRGLSDKDLKIAEGFVRGSVLLGAQAPADHDPADAAAAEIVRPQDVRGDLTGTTALENYGASLTLPIAEELDQERPDVGHLG
jgi:hypothetical protein